MSQATKKNRRLCETLKLINGYKTGQEVYQYAKERNVKVKSKPKKCPQGTFSMIQFYQSIPNYDEVRHLPEYDFSERVQLLKKVHCDLTGTLLRGPCKRPTSSASRGSKRKTSGKKKKNGSANQNSISPSLCNSFSKASLCELDEFGSEHKRSPIERISSANSFTVSTPPPLKRLQAFHEKQLTCNDNWKYDSKCPSETRCPTPKMPSPKLTPLMCSPIRHIHAHRLHHYQPVHSDLHGFDYPCEMVHHHLNLDNIHKASLSRSAECMKNSPKHAITANLNFKSPNCDTKSSKPKKKLRRAKSCPKDLFSISSKCSDNGKSPKNSAEMNEHRLFRDLGRDDLTPCFTDDFHSSPRQQNTYRKTVPKIRVQKPKSKTPNSMDEYVSSKLVHINHAAKLRQKSSRQKIHELEEEKLKARLHMSHFIPKCHKWNVRDTPAWKTFLSEDLTTEKRMREEARQEEQRVRKHAHSMSMNIMRARVKSAQLLLEGRSLSEKY